MKDETKPKTELKDETKPETELKDESIPKTEVKGETKPEREEKQTGKLTDVQATEANKIAKKHQQDAIR